MEVMYPRCAGLDLGKDTLVVCVRVHGRPVQQEVRTFGTTTRELLALTAWLTEHQVTHVAIAYASYCTSLDRWERFSVMRRLFDNLTPLAFWGGLGPGSS